MDGQTSSAASIGECESLACASHGCDVVATVEVLLGQLVRTLEREHQAAQLCRFSVRILGERQLFQHIERSRNAALLKREPSAEVQRIGVVWDPLRTWRGGMPQSIAGHDFGACTSPVPLRDYPRASRAAARSHTAPPIAR